MHSEECSGALDHSKHLETIGASRLRVARVLDIKILRATSEIFLNDLLKVEIFLRNKEEKKNRFLSYKHIECLAIIFALMTLSLSRGYKLNILNIFILNVCCIVTKSSIRSFMSFESGHSFRKIMGIFTNIGQFFYSGKEFSSI